MIKIIDTRKTSSFEKALRRRQDDSLRSVESAVARIVRRVRREGDAAVKAYTKKFDRVAVDHLKVSPQDIHRAYLAADPRLLTVLRRAAKNIRRFHEHQKRTSWKLREKFGSDLRQVYTPIDKIGVYVPGGKAAYPSTVLMNVIPAQVAGVGEIHLVSPPDRQGNVHKDVLTAAKILGVKHVYRVGGAQSIAALAFGTETIPAVDKIVGPGNIFVATAKKMVFGTVGIDSVAGPSEVIILADDAANAEFIASDMLAQSEHDERASSILVTPSEKLASKVLEELDKFLYVLPRKEIIAKALMNFGAILLVRSVAEGIAAVNILAPEHLEIVTRNDEAVLKKIRHAGSIFLGNYSPVAVGDYLAGPNHVLPTGSTARFSSPLSVDDFVKRSSVIRFTQKKLNSVQSDTEYFARRERLTAHALSVRVRGKRTKT